MMKPFFMLPGEPFDFCRDHFKVSMEVGVPNVPGRVNKGPEYFVLKPLDDSNNWVIAIIGFIMKIVVCEMFYVLCFVLCFMFYDH
jgi:hypothetical protein